MGDRDIRHGRLARGAQAGARGCPGLDAHRGLVAFLSDPARKPGSAFETRHMGSGIYRCGKCGRKMYAAYPHGKGTPCCTSASRPPTWAGLGEPLDEYVETLVLGYLSDPETRQRLTVMLDGNTVDVDGLHTQRAAMQARLDDLAATFADGAIDASHCGGARAIYAHNWWESTTRSANCRGAARSPT